MAITQKEKRANRNRLRKNQFLNNINQLMKTTPVYVDLANRLSIPFKSPDKRKDLWVENDCVTLVNCYTNKNESVPVDLIVGYRYMTIDTEPSAERTESAILIDREQIQQCVDDETVKFSLEEIIDKYCVMNQSAMEWEIQKLFKLKYSIDQLKYPDETTMSEVKEMYMDMIRSHREKSFEELDQLEQEATEQQGTAEDLEDINTIKQMFRDIPQDIDLSEYQTVHDLLQFWPSLLLPKPDSLPSQPVIDTLRPQALQLDDLNQLLMKIRDPIELQLFYTELRAEIGIDKIPEPARKMITDRIKVLELTQDITL
jgi:hypothetical protein